jgi:hypothetical protein
MALENAQTQDKKSGGVVSGFMSRVSNALSGKDDGSRGGAFGRGKSGKGGY